MKRLTHGFSILILFSVILAALLPTGSVFAAKDPGSATLVIHNNSGGKVNFDLLDSKGLHHAYSLPTGQTSLTLDAAMYSYFAGLPCGSRSGQFNLNVGKQLYLTCGDGVSMVVRKTAGRFQSRYCYNIYDIYALDDTNYLKGSFCQDTPATEFDFIAYEATIPGYGTTELPAYFLNSTQDIGPGSFCLPDFGQAYYGYIYILYGYLGCS